MFERYLMPFDTNEIPSTQTELLIIGSGVAGLYTALMVPSTVEVTIISKSSIDGTSSALAQGGIASPIDSTYDSIEQHIKDTLACGHYHNDPLAVKTMIQDANRNINRLIKLGVSFDKDKEGHYLLAREGGHSVNRILHIGGDQTGAYLMTALRKEVLNRPNITLLEEVFAIDLLTHQQHCYGLITLWKNKKHIFYSRSTLLATGGIGHLYPRTTNAKGIQGDGLAMALRAGALVRDLDLVQFHPTGFYDDSSSEQTFLISEAVRGEGAYLLNEKKQRFMLNYHPMGELAPRDVVSSAIVKEINNQEMPYVYLDFTHLSPPIKDRFPSIDAHCREHQLDLIKDLIPVSPVAHYYMGGVAVNINGQTSIKNLYACGECACTGVHGRNRLASNSLLEALVFGYRVARYITTELTTLRPPFKPVISSGPIASVDSHLEIRLKEIMSMYLGIQRNKLNLLKGMSLLNIPMKNYGKKKVATLEDVATQNKLIVTYSMFHYALNHLKEENIC